jgi:hypothetical protein
MGFFDKIKNAISRKKNEIEDRVIGKIIPGRTCYTSPSGYNSGTTDYSQPTEQYFDADHEAKMAEMRKQKEMREMELEMQMQERMMAKGGIIDSIVGAQSGLMNAATKAMEDQNKKGGNNYDEETHQSIIYCAVACAMFGACGVRWRWWQDTKQWNAEYSKFYRGSHGNLDRERYRGHIGSKRIRD